MHGICPYLGPIGLVLLLIALSDTCGFTAYLNKSVARLIDATRRFLRFEKSRVASASGSVLKGLVITVSFSFLTAGLFYVLIINPLLGATNWLEDKIPTHLEFLGYVIEARVLIIFLVGILYMSILYRIMHNIMPILFTTLASIIWIFLYFLSNILHILDSAPGRSVSVIALILALISHFLGNGFPFEVVFCPVEVEN